MDQGFIKAAAVTPPVRVADVEYNREQIEKGVEEAAAHGAKIIVFPELCLCGYTCEDLLLQDLLLEACKRELLTLARQCREIDALIFVGLPVEREGKLYNVAAALFHGEILALIPKANIPSYGEFYETRHFHEGNREPVSFWLNGKEIPFGMDLLFQETEMDGLRVGCEICEDIWVPLSPSISHAMEGATILVNLSASNETIGKDSYRELLVKSASAKLIAGYIYCSCAGGESTQDLVFGGHDLIAENGTILTQSKKFESQIIYGDIDIKRLQMERRRMSSFQVEEKPHHLILPFTLHKERTKLERSFPCRPFVPEEQGERDRRCEEILSIQSYGLRKRYEHTGCRGAVIGVSGGLDSTQALLVTVRCFDMLGLPRKNIMAVTMPCFGTTDRTYENACRLASTLGTELREIDIKEAVNIHFRDISQDPGNHDVTYENGQARERTQILMDLANQTGGLVIGTGDMSELALGWATYNGDHMSMYGVNSGVPKTLVRHLVRYYADTCEKEELREVLLDILDTPVSPELLPPVEGKISQKTEDLVGPYELHDFFLYYMLRCGFEPAKIYRLAALAFDGIYDKKTILKWLCTFYRRFFGQQFKRSCLPDGPKVGSVALSPRGDLRMPSDACVRLWLEQAEALTDLQD